MIYRLTKQANVVCMCLAILITAGCSSAYYGTMEKFGVHKRDILVDRVEEARDSQDEAKEQFSSALEQFASVTNYDGGDLQKTYNRLDSEYQKSVAIAGQVSDRIDAVEDVSKDLFKEWEKELDLYSNENLRYESERRLLATRSEYTRLINAMRNAESRIPPVLQVFQDQVLFLKHNLNARAITALQNEYAAIESDVGQLVREMEKSIDEANAFISNLKENG